MVGDFFDFVIGFDDITLFGSGFSKTVGELIEVGFGVGVERNFEGLGARKVGGSERIVIGKVVDLGRELKFKVVVIEAKNEAGTLSGDGEAEGSGLKINLVVVHKDSGNDGGEMEVEATAVFAVLDTDRQEIFSGSERR